jgi:glucose-fructose oxidoreductase
VQTAARPETHARPVETLEPPFQDPIQYLIHLLTTGEAPTGPLSPALSRLGQQIVDTARLSAAEKRTVALLP